MPPNVLKPSPPTAPVVSSGPRSAPPTPAASPSEGRVSLAGVECHPLFEQGLSLEEIARRADRAVSTVFGYLQNYLKLKRITDVSAWVPPDDRARIEDAIFRLGIQKLRPIFEDFGGTVTYEQIKIVATVIEILSEDADRNEGSPK